MRRVRPGSAWPGRSLGWAFECVLAAPGKIERPAQDRIKTDVRDPERLVRLRHDIRYQDPTSRWGRRHRDWLARLDLGHDGAQLTLSEYLGAIDALQIRRRTLETAIGELIVISPWAGDVARLRCLRGIDTLSAVGLAVEVGDLARFEHPSRLMSYLGLGPSEYSSGETRRPGAITKSGNRHARRLLVEAAWHYRPGAAVTYVGC
jgi:transposase